MQRRIDLRTLVLFSLAALAVVMAVRLVSSFDERPLLIMEAALASVPVLLLPLARRPVSRWLHLTVAGMAVVAAIAASWAVGNWSYYDGMAHIKVDDARAKTSLIEALQRMDKPGIEISALRLRLTGVGPVMQLRVTPLMTLANIELRAGDTRAAEHWITEAIAAGRADPREEADLAFLTQMLDGVRGMSGE